MKLNSVNMFLFHNCFTAAALWFGKVITYWSDASGTEKVSLYPGKTKSLVYVFLKWQWQDLKFNLIFLKYYICSNVWKDNKAILICFHRASF